MINRGQWIQFNCAWLRCRPDDVRFGQHFCNAFNIKDSEVFNEENMHEAIVLCYDRYVDHELKYCPPPLGAPSHPGWGIGTLI